MASSVYNNVHPKAGPSVWALARSVYEGTRTANLSSIWIGRGWDDNGEHTTGRALDIIVSRRVGVLPTAAEKAAGEVLVAWLVKYAESMHIRHIIWDKRIYRTRYKAWGPIYNRSGISDWHQDHVHVLFDDNSGKIPPFGENAPASKPTVYPILKKGSVGESVRVLQGALGIYVDGSFGPKTEKAVREYQASRGLNVDGVVGPQTWNAINSKAPAVAPKIPNQILKMGSKGNFVRRVQKAVGAYVDGSFGAKTEEAVKAFQKKHNLTVDGVVGPQTWNAIVATGG